MKRKLCIVFLTIVSALALAFGITACTPVKQLSVEPQQLETPVVSISEEGVASWEAIVHAVGYSYKLDDGEEIAITAHFVQLEDGQSIQVKAKGDGIRFLDGEFSGPATYTAPGSEPKLTQLEAPEVSIDKEGLATWTAVEHAAGYKYKVNDGAEQTLEGAELKVQLQDKDTIQVKAVGDGKTYSDSVYSEPKAYSAPAKPDTEKLDTPVVTISGDGLAHWETVAHASAYFYKIDGGGEVRTAETSVQLENGQSITVKAVGDGETYTDSDWSAVQTYTAQVAPPQPTQLATPVVTVNEDTGLATWVAIPNAAGYKYKVNDGAEQTLEGAELQVQLQDKDTIQVKAVGDGETYTDSDWSAVQTYTAQVAPPQPTQLATPVVTVNEDTGLATWVAIPNAAGYKYKVNDGAEQTLEGAELQVQLQDKDTITVKAVGDGETYTDSDWSTPQTYTAKPVPPQPETDYGTEEKPLSVAEALVLAGEECVENGDFTKKPVTMKGKVKNVPTKKSSSGSAYYQELYLVDLNETSKEILVWTIDLKPDVAAPDQNDTLLIQGYIKKHTDGKIEFATKDSVHVYALKNDRGESTIAVENDGGATVTGLEAGKATNGTTVRFTVTANEGKEIVSVTANGQPLTAETEGKYSFELHGNITVKVTTRDKSTEPEKEAKLLATFTLGDDVDKKETLDNGAANSEADGQDSTSYTETKNGYTLNITSGSYFYTGAYDNLGQGGFKLGSSKKSGSFTFTVPEGITKVVFYVAGYKKDDAKISINDGGTQTITKRSEAGEYEEVEVEVPENRIIKFTTQSGGYRCKINTIEFWGEAEAEPGPTKLATPAVTIDSHTGVASWDAVDNAAGYVYKLTTGDAEGEEQELPAETRTFTLTNGQKIFVKAKGDGKTYSDSDFCAPVTYTHEHDYTKQKYGSDETQHWLICDYCNEPSTEKTAHSYKEETPGKCEVCGKEHTSHTYEGKNGKCDICFAAHTGDDHVLAQKSDEHHHWTECEVCGATTEKTAHSELVYGYDDSQHWKKCPDCGWIDESTKKPHEYKWDEGQSKELCECGRDKNHQHDWRWEQTEQGHKQVCNGCGHTQNEGDHTYEEVPGTCDTCSYTHTAHQNVTKFDKDNHWDECSVCHLKQNVTAHSEFTWQLGENGKHQHICGVCHNVADEHGALTGDWGHNETDHWHACTGAEGCTLHIGETPHGESLRYKSVDDTYHHQKCEQCGYTTGNSEHTYSGYSQSADGTKHYQTCTQCGHQTAETDHVYDREGNKCVCGKVDPDVETVEDALSKIKEQIGSELKQDITFELAEGITAEITSDPEDAVVYSAGQLDVDEYLKGVEVSLTVTVRKGSITRTSGPLSVTIDTTLPENARTVTVTVEELGKQYGWLKGQHHKEFFLDHTTKNIKIVATGEANVGYFGGTNWRLYRSDSSTMQLQTANGAALHTIKITWAAQDNGALQLDNKNYISDTVVPVTTNSKFTVANSKGKADITAITVVYTGGKTEDEANQAIADAAVSGITGIPESLSIEEGKSRSLTLTLPGTAEVGYTLTSGSELITVEGQDGNYTLRAGAIGSQSTSVTLTVTAEYKEKTAQRTFTVTVTAFDCDTYLQNALKSIADSFPKSLAAGATSGKIELDKAAYPDVTLEIAGGSDETIKINTASDGAFTLTAKEGAAGSAQFTVKVTYNGLYTGQGQSKQSEPITVGIVAADSPESKLQAAIEALKTLLDENLPEGPLEEETYEIPLNLSEGITFELKVSGADGNIVAEIEGGTLSIVVERGASEITNVKFTFTPSYQGHTNPDYTLERTYSIPATETPAESTITLTANGEADGFGVTGSSYSSGTKEIKGITFAYKFAANSTRFQFNKKQSSYLYNTSAIENNIISVTLKGVSGSVNVIVSFGEASRPSGGESKSIPSNNGDLEFKSNTGSAKFFSLDTSANGAVYIDSIEIKYSTKVLSDQEKAQAAAESLSLGKTELTVVGDQIDLPATGEYDATIAWAMDPQESEYVTLEADKLTVKKLPTDADQTVTLTATAEVNGKTAQSSPFTITIKAEGSEPAVKTWTKVTSAGDLRENAKIIFVSGKVVSGGLSGEVLEAIKQDAANKATFSDDNTITDLGGGVYWTLRKSGDNWQFVDDSGKALGATAAKKLALDKGTTTWTISFSGSSITVSNTTTSYGKLFYNSGSPRFTTYTSSQAAISIFIEQS